MDARRSGGFSLLEVLVALSILGICLLFLTQILVQESVVERRSSARASAISLLEAHAELVRAGLPLPRESAEVEIGLLVEPPFESRLDDAVVTAHVEPMHQEGLYAVDLVMTYRYGSAPGIVSMEMRLWRP